MTRKTEKKSIREQTRTFKKENKVIELIYVSASHDHEWWWRSIAFVLALNSAWSPPQQWNFLSLGKKKTQKRTVVLFRDRVFTHRRTLLRDPQKSTFHKLNLFNFSAWKGPHRHVCFIYNEPASIAQLVARWPAELVVVGSIPFRFPAWPPCVEISAHVKKASVGQNYPQCYPAASLKAMVALRRHTQWIKQTTII